MVILFSRTCKRMLIKHKKQFAEVLKLSMLQLILFFMLFFYVIFHIRKAPYWGQNVDAVFFDQY